MSVHIRIPLSDKQKRIMENAKKGIHGDWSQFENDYDWDTYDALMAELHNPFLNVFTLRDVYRDEVCFLFWSSSLKYQFESPEDYLKQAAEYRKQHHLKPIEELTKEDVKEYQEWRYKEAQKIRKKIFGDDYEMMV